MKVSFVCNDTRGGVQPYLALGLALRRRGHRVQIVAPEGFRADVGATGLEFAGMRGDVHASMQRPEVLEAIERGFLATHRLMVRLMDETIREATMDCLAACEGSDGIVCGFGGMLCAEGVAEKLGVPLLQAHLQPLFSTGGYPGLVAMRSLQGLGLANWVSHCVTRQVFWQPVRGAVNRARRDVLGVSRAPLLGSIGRPQEPGTPVLYGYSPSLLPRPRDARSEVHVTGYWCLDAAANWQPPERLVSFMESGPAPVAIGFGSMTSRDARATAQLVLRAVEQVGCRAVLLSGWGGMEAEDLPEWACLLESVPHDWLFARCAAAVHHGGAGTTGASVRAGIPTIVVPFAADQPFWAWLVERRGVGMSAGPRKRLTSEGLSEVLRRVLSDHRMKARAADLGGRVRAEDGAAVGAALIGNWISRRQTRIPAEAP